LRTSAYRCIDKLGITHFVHERQFPRRKTMERASFYLDDAQPGWRNLTSDCFFGHTHLPFSDCEHEGIIYHNTGSAIDAMEFNPVFFKLDAKNGNGAATSPQKVAT
jgi:predicted phosphodiesterase